MGYTLLVVLFLQLCLPSFMCPFVPISSDLMMWCVYICDSGRYQTSGDSRETLGIARKIQVSNLDSTSVSGFGSKLMQSPGGGENGNNAMARMYLIKLSSESEAKSLADAILANAPNT